MDRRRSLLAASTAILVDGGGESGGGQFYVNCDNYFDVRQFTFTIDSPKTWNECIGMKDDTGEIRNYI